MYIPEMARDTTNRWISEVPSKIVKILWQGGAGLWHS
jgi:hypothetical protein